jgi:hypothetical protein
MNAAAGHGRIENIYKLHRNLVLINKRSDKRRDYNTNILMTVAINRGIRINANAGLNRYPITPRL